MNNTLRDPMYRKLHISEIKPAGWLKEQLRIQANGLSGNLDKFWPDIKDSQWIGGPAEGWERVPYWLDGFLPLAWLLEEEDLKARGKKYIDRIIASQAEDGWICPDNNQRREEYDVWATFLILKVLVLYHDISGDDRIEAVVEKALKSLDSHIDNVRIFEWAKSRWFECLISIHWLYERKNEEWLLALAKKLEKQGFDWQTFFSEFFFYHGRTVNNFTQYSHVVNNAMMLKAGALRWRMTGAEDDFAAAEKMMAVLDKFHGMVTGVFSGDEHLAGTSPVQGTELCAVAEYMYSLEHLLEITGNPMFGDRLEKIAFNALPATYSPDMWTHQYDQQVNQVECSKQQEPLFMTNNGESTLFGLEPNFGCCTSNLSQPWPKFALSVFARSASGFVSAVHAPCSVFTKINNINVSLALETEYPFKDTLNYTVHAEDKVNFTLSIRIPQWANGAYIVLEGRKVDLNPGTFYDLNRDWSGTVSFKVCFPMTASLISRPNKLYAIERGPLVYSLKIDENWVQVNNQIEGHEYPHCDYEIYAASPWNYALNIDKDNLASSITFEEGITGDFPFSPAGAPIRASVSGKRIKWDMCKGAALPYPPEIKFISEKLEALVLIPYGCTNLRMTEMPIIED